MYLPSPLAVYLVAVAPLLWLGWRLLTRGRQMATVYAMLLFTTFLGALARPGGVSVSIALAFVIVVIEVFVLKQLQRVRLRINAIDICVTGIAVWALLGVAVSASGLSHVREPIVLALIVLAAKFRPSFEGRDFRIIATALVAGAVVVALMCITQARSGDPTLFGMLKLAPKYMMSRVERPTGLQGNPNAASLYLLIGFCASLVLVSRRAGRLRNGALVFSSIVIAIGLLDCASRSAVIGAGLAATIRVGWALGLRRTSTHLAIIAFGLLVVLLPQQLGSAGQQLFESRDVLSIGREDRWNLAWNVISQHPFFGDPTITYFYQPVNYHNDLLQIAAYYGLLPAVLFTALLAILARFSWRASVVAKDMGFSHLLLLILITGFLHSMFHVQLVGGICFWMLLSLGFNNTAMRRRAASATR